MPALREALAQPAPIAPIGLYVHLPFCQKKCDYCYFLSYIAQPAAVVDRYLDAVVREMELYATQPGVKGRPVSFAYFGGGRPSTLNTTQLRRLGDGLRRALSWDGIGEVTFECAPRSVRREFLQSLREMGVTRVSMGVQSFDNELLKLNGRVHAAEDVARAFGLLREAVFGWVNLDLMCGLLGETEENWRESIRQVIELGPDSVTIYQTEIPHNTQLYRDLEAGVLPAPPLSWGIKRARLDTGFRAEVPAKVVVDASGRACVIGRQLGLRSPLPELRKASAWGYFRGGKRLPGIVAGETTMFLIPGGGWFWYIPLPDDIVSVGIVADPEYIFSESDDMEAAFTREVALCAPLADRLRDAQRVGPVRGARHLAYLNRQTCGDGWLMIGDARAFLDPIYSSGLYLALGSAELAAQCIDDALKNNDISAARLGAFEPALWKGVDVVRRLIHTFYDPNFSFPKFAQRFPEHRAALIDCLVGDVIKDMSTFTTALAQMTPPPPPLGSNLPEPATPEMAST